MGRRIIDQMRANWAPDPPGWGQRERELSRQLAAQANAEMMARFAPLTRENAQAAIDWQSARIKALMVEHGLDRPAYGA